MVVFFSIIVPAVIVGAGALLFLKSRSPALRAVALLVVAGPGLLIAATRLRSAVIDSHVRRNAEGSGYFSGREMQQAGAAVVRGDAAALRAIGKSIDINAKGADGMTLMELAVTRADDSAGNAGPAGATLDVVRELIAEGADPNAGLKVATKLKDITILSALLDAGAKPGFADDHGPVIFSWLNVMPIAGAMALLDHHLDPNITDASGVPFIVAAAQQDRWNIVLLLMDRGADPLRADPHGTRLADVVQSRVESSSARPPEMMLDITKVKLRLGR
jgi:ankyrin repeat protein